jgi:hypothetical protein
MRLNNNRFLLTAAISGCCFVFAGRAENATNAPDWAGVIRVNGRDLQQVINDAPPHSTVLCDPKQQLTLSVPITIPKPLTLRNLKARLPDQLGKTPLVVVAAKGVTLADFELTGNGETVPQDKRAPLLVIGAGDFRVENGQMFNSSKDGIMIEGTAAGDEDLVGGVIRDIVGHKIIRDVVSIGGSGVKGHRIRNVLVDNVRCYDSALRGAVEVSDGTDNITVRKVYAEGSVYAIDVQDHNKPAQINRNVVIEDVYALRCKHAIRTANHPFGHANLTVRDLTAQQCQLPVQISNTDNLALYNVRVLDHDFDGPPIFLRNCRGVSVRDVTVENTAFKGPGLLLEDCDGALIDGFTLRGQTDSLVSGICYRVTTGGALSGLRISNVFAPGVKGVGILLEATGKKKGTLADYLVAGNLARVEDRIQGPRATILNNLP